MRFFYFILLFYSSVWADSQQPSFADIHIHPFLEKATDQTSQFILVGGLVSVVGVNSQDDYIRDDWKKYHHMSQDAAKTGDLMGSGAVGALSMGAQYLWDTDRDNWVSHARALVWSTVFSSVMKYSFGRPRPGNSDSHYSFPSGHTTTAFTTATSLTYAYGWKAAVVAYPIATFVGLSRLSDDVHWGSDVVAGAFIGFWAARASFYSTKDIEEKIQQSALLPVVSPEQLGVSWVYRF